MSKDNLKVIQDLSGVAKSVIVKKTDEKKTELFIRTGVRAGQND
jgi:hypothetical protein